MALYRTGIDIGSHALRGVVLKRKGNGWTWQQGVSVSCLDVDGNSRDVSELLQELKRKLKIRGPVHMVDSSLAALVRFIEHPPVPAERLARGMRMELHEHADEFGNLAADYQVVPVANDDLCVCCALAQPGQVDALMALCRRLGLPVEQLGLSLSAAANAWSLLRWQLPRPILDDDNEADEEIEDDAVEAVLEIGASGSRIVLLRGGKFLGARSIPLGGQRFTDELVVARSLNRQTAEAMKVAGQATIGIAEKLAAAEDADDDDIFLTEEEEIFVVESGDELPTTQRIRAQTQQAEDVQQSGEYELQALPEAAPISAGLSEVPDLEAVPVAAPGAETLEIGLRELGPELRPVADQLHMQVMSALNWFRVQLKQPQLQLRRVVLMGGGAALSGLPAYLKKRLRLPVYLPQEPDFAVLEQAEGLDLLPFAGAIGAALPAAQQAMAVDLRSEQDQRQQLLSSHGRLPYFAAALLLLAAMFWVLQAWLQQSADATSLEAYKDHKKEYDKLERRLQDLRGDSQALQEDLRFIAARIFSGRDLLATIRALKEEAPKELWVTELRTEDLTGEDDEDSGDLQIARGTLYVEGRVKPLNEGAAARVNTLENWASAIARWQYSGGSRLFLDEPTLVINNSADDLAEGESSDEQVRARAFASGEFSFNARFEFVPTEIEEVIAGEVAE